MPLYRLACDTCGREVNLLLTTPLLEAPPCGCPGAGKLVRAGAGPSARVVEKLDNGAMARPVERLRDAEELHADRAAAADPRAGGGKGGV